MTTSGTCNVQIAVDGTGVGSTYNVSSTPNEIALGTPIQVIANTASHSIGFIVTSASSAANEVTLAIAIASD